MKSYINSNLMTTATLASLLLLVGGCSDNNDDSMTVMPAMNAMYQIDVYNITNDQPLTPVAAITHTSGYQAWQLGSAASTGLEMLAESGDPTALLAEADASTNVTATDSSSSGPFAPGSSQSVTVSTPASATLQLSVATMLANTNDAFTGIANVDIGTMSNGDTISFYSHVFDAGTEANTETAATMPGPAAMGEGFNAARDDSDFVTIHAGVVTFDDGLSTSALNEAHRWQGPAAKIVVARLQ